MRRARKVAGQPWQEPRRNARQRQRSAGAEDALQRLAHFAIRM